MPPLRLSVLFFKARGIGLPSHSNINLQSLAVRPESYGHGATFMMGELERIHVHQRLLKTKSQTPEELAHKRMMARMRQARHRQKKKAEFGHTM